MAGKRKTPEELSTNPRTMKVRKRNERLAENSFQAEVAKAKTNDQAAVTYAKSKLLKTLHYQQASQEQRDEMIKESKEKVLYQRSQLGLNWQKKAFALGVGKEGGLFAKTADNSPAWEDIDYESADELEFESMWRQDEKQNAEGKVQGQDRSAAIIQGARTLHEQTQDQKVIEFRAWQRNWRTIRTSLFQKIKKLNSRRKLPDRIRPGQYFTEEEKAIWRNINAWDMAKNVSVWVDLPGPANWWPEDHKLDATGFFIPSIAPEQLYQAMKLVIGDFKDNVPLAYQLVLPFNPPRSKELAIAKDTLRNRNYLADFWQKGGNVRKGKQPNLKKLTFALRK